MKLKMRLTGFLAFALLSISILSYGVNGSAFADTHNIAPLTLSPDVEIISYGGIVTVTGSIKDYDSKSLTAGALVWLITTPDGKQRAGLGQEIPNEDGSFEFNFKAGGPLWKLNGDYTIEAKYGANTNTILINYVGGEPPDSPPSPVEPPVVEPPPVETPIEPPVAPPIVEPPPPPPPPPPAPPAEPKPLQCGPGTERVDGVCVPIKDEPKEKTGGCLIATATYGTELAPQVQLLREIRDNTLFSTTSGTAFMSGFNTLYYSFAPTVSDWERENPMFKEAVKLVITPMLSTLSIMSLADQGSEAEVLGLGISVIALNLGMYIAAPALIGFKVNKIIKSRK